MSFEEKIYNIVSSKAKQRKVGFIVLGLLIFAVAMIPTKIVLAKMLPGKSANTYSIYIDTATNSTIEQTKEVYPGLVVAGMAAVAVSRSHRMGPVFGGMLNSGKRAAEIILKGLK